MSNSRKDINGNHKNNNPGNEINICNCFSISNNPFCQIFHKKSFLKFTPKLFRGREGATPTHSPKYYIFYIFVS